MPKSKRATARKNDERNVLASLVTLSLCVTLAAGGGTMIAVLTASGISQVGRVSAVNAATIPVQYAQTSSSAMSPLEQRENIMKRTITVTALPEDGSAPPPRATIILRQYPSWVKMENVYGVTRAVLNTERIAQELPIALKLPAPVDCELTSVAVDEHGVRRAVTDCAHAAPGYEVSARTFIDLLLRAIENNVSDISIPVVRREGSIRNLTSDTLGTMEFLSAGRSDFAGSGEGRKSNVRKALRERVNNVVIAAGETASFNAMIGDLRSRDGWKEALGIFGGTTLKPTLGGGICQASTTVYRAVLRAGLPLGKMKNHSLFVSYYEKYGVGQDVTVFMGAQDFTFINDTQDDILLQAYVEGTEARVVIYGMRDGRTVTLDGPYFNKNAPEDMIHKGKKIRKNEIAWNRIITRADGSVFTELLVSRYNALPRSLPDRWIAAASTQTHAAATEVALQR